MRKHEKLTDLVTSILDLGLEKKPDYASIVFEEVVSAFWHSMRSNAVISINGSFEERYSVFKSYYSETGWADLINAAISLVFELDELEEKNKSENSIEVRNLFYIFELKVTNFLIGFKDQLVHFVNENENEFDSVFFSEAVINRVFDFLEKTKEFYEISNEVIACPNEVTLDSNLFSLASSFRAGIPLFVVHRLAAMYLVTKSSINESSFLVVSTSPTVGSECYISMHRLLPLVEGGFGFKAISDQIEALKKYKGPSSSIGLSYLRDMLKHRNKNFEMNQDFFIQICSALKIYSDFSVKTTELSIEVLSIALKMLPNPESFEEKEAILRSLFQHLNALNFGKDELCEVLQRCINICCKKVTDKEAIKAMAKNGAFGEDIGEKDVQELLDNMHSSEADILILTGIFSKTNNESPLRVFGGSEHALIPKMLGYE